MLLDIVKKGSTDRSVLIRIVDSSTFLPEEGVEHNTSGIDLWYRREGAAATSITEVALAALTTAHTDGGIEHVGDGYYRLDLPDAAFATGANYVDVGGTVTGMLVHGGRIRLVDYELENPAGQYEFAGTESVGGNLQFRRLDGSTSRTPYYSIWSAEGAWNAYDFSNNQLVDWETVQSSTWSDFRLALTSVSDAGAASTPFYGNDNGWASLPAGLYVLTVYESSSYNAPVSGTFLAYFEGVSAGARWYSPPYPILEDTGTTLPASLTDIKNAVVGLDTTVSSVTSQTALVLSAGSTVNDAYKGMIARIGDASNSDHPSYHNISGYTGSSKTLTLENTPNFTVVAADSVVILPAHPFLQDIIRKDLAHTHTSDSGTKSVTVSRA